MKKITGRFGGVVAATSAAVVAAAIGVVAGSIGAHAATGDVVIGNTKLEVSTGLIPNGTDTYQAFNCAPGEMLVSATASRQVGSEDAVALDIVDHEADAYPDGVVVAIRNATGEDQYYRVSLICGSEITL